MSCASGRRVPILLWPFHAVWRLLTFILGLTGRVVAFVLGVLLLAAGGVLAATLIGAPLGVPLALVGVLLVLRSLF